MLSRMALYSISILLMIFIAACQPAGSTSTPAMENTPRGELATSTSEATIEQETPTLETTVTPEMTPEMAETPMLTSTLPNEQTMLHGEEIFTANCSSCHGPEGEGNGNFPALVNNPEVTAGETMAITQLLVHGKDGQHDFSDELSNLEIASVLTFIRNAWGNEGTPVMEEEVQMAEQKPPSTPTP